MDLYLEDKFVLVLPLAELNDAQLADAFETLRFCCGVMDAKKLIKRAEAMRDAINHLAERKALGLVAQHTAAFVHAPDRVRFKEVFPEIAAHMHRNAVRPPTHALKPEATHENPVVLCEDPEARYATPWPTTPLAPNGPVTCIACLHIITRDQK